MKAIVYHKYGSPDVLQLQDIPKPTPKDNEVLIRVEAASVNPLDWHIMRGTPRLVRLSMGFSKPKHPRLGADTAGLAEAVGKDVKDFRSGDAVFGAPLVLGSLAEYVCVPGQLLAHKPANISFEEAAASPVAAITAIQSLRTGKIKPGQRVLVNGSSGGVGTFTVQIAKAYGAEVTAVCSTRNVELVKSIGADEVVDYSKQDFSQLGRRFDLVIDNVGNKTISDYKSVLKQGGTCVVIGYTTASMLLHHIVKAPWATLTGKERIVVMGSAQMNKTDMVKLADFLETGQIKPVIDRRYPLNETPEAMRYLEEGHARAKVVINI